MHRAVRASRVPSGGPGAPVFVGQPHATAPVCIGRAPASVSASSPVSSVTPLVFCWLGVTWPSVFSCPRPLLISAPLGRVCSSLGLRPALPSALQSSHDSLAGGHSATARPRGYAGSHTGGQLPGARASGTAAEVARAWSAGPWISAVGSGQPGSDVFSLSLSAAVVQPAVRHQAVS